jgi:predicted nucleic acid-binding protein
LLCGGFAIVTQWDAGGDPANPTSALEKSSLTANHAKHAGLTVVTHGRRTCAFRCGLSPAEFRTPRPNDGAVDWLLACPEKGYFVAVESVPEGRKRALEHWFDAGASPLSAETGLKWAKLLARLRTTGKAAPIKDSLIAATALTHNLFIATRNRSDFAKAEVAIV